MDIATLRQKIEVESGNLEARQYLVSALMDSGDQDVAILELKQIIRLWPDLADAYMMLGVIYQKQSEWTESGKMFSQVVKLQPERVPALVGLASVFNKLNNYEQAIINCQKALEIKPEAKNALRLLAFSLIENNQKDEGRKVLEKFVSLYPDTINADYFLAALSGTNQPDQSPEKYVKDTFDVYAENFENSLVKVLNYNVPELLDSKLRQQVSEYDNKFDIIDLGCGTGLMGQQLTDICSYLIGVDLSEKMLEQAAQKNIYDELICKDIFDTLIIVDRKFDVVVATDVFIYIGRLDSVFKAIHEVMRPGALFGFSIEVKDDNSSFELQGTGRYAQSVSYIRQLADDNDFQIRSSEKITVRSDHNKLVDGYIFVLMK
jgi:predicted TPR repeat methyltransferase